MKVHTNAGAVELTVDMVRPGMVFQDPPGAPYKLVRFDPYAVAWSDSDGALTEAEVAVAHTFLGCDPAIAAREDVERYGVAPDIDAGAHGFARLQDGGAVDFRRNQLPIQNEDFSISTYFDCDRSDTAIPCFSPTGRLVSYILPRRPPGVPSPQEARRRAAEAPLVALVKAVPAGLDPVGWRAAVLAASEANELDPAEPGKLLAPCLGVFAAGLARGLSLDSAVVEATAATQVQATLFGLLWVDRPRLAAVVRMRCLDYARAIAPQGPRPRPFRRKSPGLPLDIDADLAGLDARAGR